MRLSLHEPRSHPSGRPWLPSASLSSPETMVDEIGATFGPWDFDLADVRVPVRAWHGTLDPAPAAVIRFVVDGVPDGDLTEYRDEAHMLSDAHHTEWLTALTKWAQ
jgi:hypothetical protein